MQLLDYFVDKDKTIRNMEHVVDGFNEFFAGIEPDLARKIGTGLVNRQKSKFNVS